MLSFIQYMTEEFQSHVGFLHPNGDHIRVNWKHGEMMPSHHAIAAKNGFKDAQDAIKHGLVRYYHYQAPNAKSKSAGYEFVNNPHTRQLVSNHLGSSGGFNSIMLDKHHPKNFNDIDRNTREFHDTQSACNHLDLIKEGINEATAKRPCTGPNCGCTTNHVVASHPETGESMWKCTNCDHLSPKTTRTSKKKKELDDLFDKLGKINEDTRKDVSQWGVIHPATGKMIDGNKIPGIGSHMDLRVHLSKTDDSVPAREWHKAPEYAHVADSRSSGGMHHNGYLTVKRVRNDNKHLVMQNFSKLPHHPSGEVYINCKNGPKIRMYNHLRTADFSQPENRFKA